MRQFKLFTTDGKALIIDERRARTLGRVRYILQREDVKDGDSILLNKVKYEILEKVLEWTARDGADKIFCCVAVQNDAEKNGKLEMSLFAQQFLNVDNGTLFELIKASIYLGVPDLRELTSRYFAQMLRGKSAQQIRDMFNIKNDLSPAEEALLRAESAWCKGADGL